jgi:hypothetical protein
VYDERILMFTLNNMHREVIDRWAQEATDWLRNCPDEIPFLTLVDLSAPNMTATPYLRERSSEMIRVRPEKAGRTAIVLPYSITTRAMQGLFILINRLNQHRRRKIFLKRDEAIAWLAETLN